MAVLEVSKPSREVMFASRRDGLRLTKVQRYPLYGASGQQVGEKPGQALKFQDGTIRVTEEGVALAEGGVLPREEALTFLRGHRLFGDQQEGFWEIQQAAPPVSQDELEAMMQAAWDEGALQHLIEQEEAGWGREALLTPARHALDRLLQAKADIAAQAAQDASEPVQKPATKRSAR